MKKRIAFMGAGAVGGYVGGQLARAGHDVTLIDPWPAHIEAIRASGLEIIGVSEAEHCIVKPNTMHLTEVQSLSKQKPIDIAFVSVKSYDTEWATMLISSYLAADGYVVSLQNCINEERIAGIVGWGRTLGCVAARLAADLYEPGRILRTSPKGSDMNGNSVFYLGEVHGRSTQRARELAEMLGGVDTVTLTTNLWGERWSKLCVNAMRNGASAATGLSGIARDRHDAIRRFCIRLGGEAVRIGQAQGYELGYIGFLDPERLARGSEGDKKALAEVEAVLVAGTNDGKHERQRPSMGQDMIKGRRTEIDYINGFVVQKAHELGKTAPANAFLTGLVRRVERGKIAARPENLTVPEAWAGSPIPSG
jgi:2-dehydropantoate 2-reductase